ncbi:MAG: NAD(+)/NADH kinase [Firmicutes bacterium]|nr:NAD(+)/NADH kinase [Bacillota bacterium]
MKRIGIMAHLGKPRALELAAKVKEFLAASGLDIWVPEEAAEVLGWGPASEKLYIGGHPLGVDAAVVLGGDGTLLHAAGFLAPFDIPMLSVNVGYLGFLSEVEASELEPTLQALISNQFEIEERMLLEAVVKGEDKEERFLAVNDVVITRAAFARMIHLKIDVDGVSIGDFVADGLIVSTPTGSTAYSLSAGGPIVHPRLETILVTPICPHSLATRSILALPDEVVRVRVVPDRTSKVVLTADGQTGVAITPEDSVLVRKADVRAKFIKLGRRNFYQVLGQRLNYPALHPPHPVT